MDEQPDVHRRASVVGAQGLLDAVAVPAVLVPRIDMRDRNSGETCPRLQDRGCVEDRVAAETLIGG